MATSSTNPAYRTALARVESDMDKVRNLAKRVRTEHEDFVSDLVHGGLTVVFGILTGIYQGRYGEKKIAGMRAEIVVAVVAIAWGLYAEDDLGDYAFSAGLGVLTVAGASWGAERGIEWRNKALPGGAPAQPQVPAAAGNGGMRLGDEVLNRMGATLA